MSARSCRARLCLWLSKVLSCCLRNLVSIPSRLACLLSWFKRFLTITTSRRDSAGGPDGGEPGVYYDESLTRLRYAAMALPMTQSPVVSLASNATGQAMEYTSRECSSQFVGFQDQNIPQPSPRVRSHVDSYASITVETTAQAFLGSIKTITPAAIERYERNVVMYVWMLTFD